MYLDDTQVTVCFENTRHLSKSIHTVDLCMKFIKIKYKLKSCYNLITKISFLTIIPSKKIMLMLDTSLFLAAIGLAV